MRTMKNLAAKKSELKGENIGQVDRNMTPNKRSCCSVSAGCVWLKNILYVKVVIQLIVWCYILYSAESCCKLPYCKQVSWFYKLSTSLRVAQRFTCSSHITENLELYMFLYHPLTAAPPGSFVIRATAKSIVLADGCAFSLCIQSDILLCVFSSWTCTGMSCVTCVPYDSY